MAEPNLLRRRSHAEQLAHHVLFQAVWAFAWGTLRRYGFADADREDVAQDALVTAWRKRAQYDPDRGTLEQWLSGILHYAALAFRRKRARGPALVPGDMPLDIPTEALTPEDRVSLSLLAEHAFSFLPPEERRVVILHEIDGKHLREIATIEGIHYTTAHARLKRGMAGLQKAKDDGSVGASFAAALGIPVGEWSEPPPETVERAWARAVVELGLGEPPDSEPPESGLRSVDPGPPHHAARPPSSRPPAGRSTVLRLLGPFVGGILGALAAGHALGQCSPHPRPETPAAGPLASAESASTVFSTATAASLSTALTSSAPTASSCASAPQLPASPPRVAPVNSSRAEQVVLDRARWALAAGEFSAALTALSEHAERFPHGRQTALREQLWSEACSRYRSAHAHRDPPERRCTGR